MKVANPRHGLSGLLASARREVGATVALLVLALGGLAFLSIADEVAEGETRALDLAILLALRRPGAGRDLVGPDWLHLAAIDVTALGSLAVLGLLVLLACAVMACLERWGEAALLLVGAGGGLAISQGLKALFMRERPDLAFRAVEAVNASFPSGHAMLSAVVFLILGALGARFSERRRLKVLALSAAVGLSLLVGISRIYLGVHWASDVLAGWCVGAAWAMACWLAALAWTRWRT
ncbi:MULTISPECIES: phosphatase PAP2 family protein [unclassified Caulobacter]|uniref:phosphatase PAP2 family protein n=1 Tax=unclassified Caulobacter TaxID=2648921 RepID=UPI000D38DD6C|nr:MULTISPECIES: phosphatase PAP2 family protein [unclassified Caulobacter]PTS89689.1 phosphoesterase [Caulobacter sp. HMWF009]PTT12121.1 phosphoesterase [Caulobacter sp. HMWF025]PTT78374.1 phosphoesterase [Pseudomonas sp. HMWF010]